MIISITGVSGAGKTSVAKELAKNLHAKIIHLRKFTEDVKIYYDSELKTNVVDTEKLKKLILAKIKKELKNSKTKTIIIDGILSYIIPCDLLIILRISPKKLEQRLKKRKFNKKKISENINAEILDYILAEALIYAKKAKILQIDASKKSAKTIAKLIVSFISKNKRFKKFCIGKKLIYGDYVDWMRKYASYLKEV